MTDRNVASWFERNERSNSGKSFYALADNAPEWLKDAVREAHDGEWPDDWRYDTCDSIVRALDDWEDLDDTDDFAHECADGLVDIYTGDLIEWLTIDRLTYCDQTNEDCELAQSTSMADRIRIGQYDCIRQMCYILQVAYCEAVSDGAS